MIVFTGYETPIPLTVLTHHLETTPNVTMIRKAFVMSVHAGSEEEYARRHQPIWDDLTAELKAHGVHNYYIYLEPTTRQLFAFVEFDDEAHFNAIANAEVCQRWWRYMSDIMPTNPDHSPVMRNLKEVFRLN